MSGARAKLDAIRRGHFRGVDLRALTEALWCMPAMHGEVELPAGVASGACRAPELRIRVHGAFKAGGGESWGKALPAFRHVTLEVGERAPVGEVVAVLVHEVVHCACPPSEQHGEVFRLRLASVAREAFGLNVPDETASPGAPDYMGEFFADLLTRRIGADLGSLARSCVGLGMAVNAALGLGVNEPSLGVVGAGSAAWQEELRAARRVL